MIIVRSNITVEEALKLESDDYDLFRQIFERVRDLYARSAKDSDSRKIAFESVAKKEIIKEILQLRLEFLSELENRDQNENFDEYLVYFYALNTIDLAYKYCCSLDMGETNSLSKLMLTHAKKTYLGKGYLLEMLDSLSTLEDITASHKTDVVARHFIEKAIEKATKEARQPQSKGGKVKAENDAKRLDPAKEKLREIWDKDNWTSRGRGKYVDFAEYITYNDMVDGVNFDFVRTYISKYDKLKF